MELREAVDILSKCTRSESRDHAFGDAEVFWNSPEGAAIAEGYFGGGDDQIWFTDHSILPFSGENARALRNCGFVGAVERNDETGPDEFTEGQMLESMTKGAVFEELTRNKLQEN